MGSCTSNNTIAPHSLRRAEREKKSRRTDSNAFVKVSSPNWEDTSINQKGASGCQHKEIQEAYSDFKSFRTPFLRIAPAKKHLQSEDADSGVWLKCRFCRNWLCTFPQGFTEQAPILNKNPFKSSALVARRSQTNQRPRDVSGFPHLSNERDASSRVLLHAGPLSIEPKHQVEKQ